MAARITSDVFVCAILLSWCVLDVSHGVEPSSPVDGHRIAGAAGPRTKTAGVEMTTERPVDLLVLADALLTESGLERRAGLIRTNALVDRGVIYSQQTPVEARAAAGTASAESEIYGVPVPDVELGVFLNYGPTTGFAFPGTMLADNLGLGNGFQPGGKVSSYELRLFRSTLDPQEGTLADIHVELWDGDPLCQVDTPASGYACAPIPGTGADFVGLAVGERATFRAVLPEPATIPHERVWMVVSTPTGTPNAPPCRLGWIIGGVRPRIGNDAPADMFELQCDIDGSTNGLGACCTDGASCEISTDPCPGDEDPGFPRGFCSDGDAEDAALFSTGEECVEGQTPYCLNFVASVFAPTETTISIVPASASGPHTIVGNEIFMEPGQTVVLEFHIAGWDPDRDGSPQLKAWMVQIDPSGYAGGLQGTLTPVSGPACTTDADCRGFLGAVCHFSGDPCTEDSDCTSTPSETCESLSRCGGVYSSSDQCAPGFINSHRADYVFIDLEDISASDFTKPYFRFAAVALFETFADPGVPKYVATVVLEVPPDAHGTFTVAPVSAARFGPANHMIDQDNQLIPLVGLLPAKITVGINPLAAFPKNRYLTVAEGTPGRTQAIRVVFADLPPPFDIRNGTSMWVAEPRDVSENGHHIGPTIPGFADFKSSTLRCDPFFADWSLLGGPVHVFHADIVPGATYDIEVVDQSDPATVVSRSSIVTHRWGDVVGPFNADLGFWTEPDGSVDVFNDALATLDAFRSAGGAPHKVRVDIQPATPDSLVSIIDVMWILEAFQGRDYPFSPGPAPCP